MKHKNILKLLTMSLISMMCFTSCSFILGIFSEGTSSSQSGSSSLSSSSSNSSTSSSSSSVSSSSSSSSSSSASNSSPSSTSSSTSTSSSSIASSTSSSSSSSKVTSSQSSSSQTSINSSQSSIEEGPFTNFVSIMDSYVPDTNDPLDPNNGGLDETELETITNIIQTYYASVNNTYKGETLWDELQTVTEPTKLVKYEELKDVNKGNAYADQSATDSTKLVDFYTGAFLQGSWVSGGKIWNREHVWCQSHGWWGNVGESKRCAGSDLHHLRPSDPGINSSRNNSPYGEIPNRDTYKKSKTLNGVNYHYGYLTGSLHPDGVFEPTDRMKGDVARILLYMEVRYKEDFVTINKTPITEIVYTSEGSEEAAYALLLKWHEQDPVSNFEIARNHRTYLIQGNRNPFIDCPKYATAIFENL